MLSTTFWYKAIRLKKKRPTRIFFRYQIVKKRNRTRYVIQYYHLDSFARVSLLPFNILVGTNGLIRLLSWLETCTTTEIPRLAQSWPALRKADSFGSGMLFQCARFFTDTWENCWPRRRAKDECGRGAKGYKCYRCSVRLGISPL